MNLLNDRSNMPRMSKSTNHRSNPQEAASTDDAWLGLFRRVSYVMRPTRRYDSYLHVRRSLSVIACSGHGSCMSRYGKADFELTLDGAIVA